MMMVYYVDQTRYPGLVHPCRKSFPKSLTVTARFLRSGWVEGQCRCPSKAYLGGRSLQQGLVFNPAGSPGALLTHEGRVAGLDANNSSVLRVVPPYMMKPVYFAVALALAAAASGEEVKSARNDFLSVFAVQSTTTYTIVSASTSTVFFSCLSGSYTALICQGRKKKSIRAMPDLDSISSDVFLDTSSDSAGSPAIERDDDPTNSEKFGYTVWTVAKTTTTVTVRYTNTASTIKISYYCGAGGINYPPNSC
ncbi:uncharacterized protein LOC134769450 [Penaeus indicus]|uniref:uncharacterized protein LOC134769450 n=1 Tax=Penaeus indicus TaxID=29960 RepID=UPI00300C1A7F